MSTNNKRKPASRTTRKPAQSRGNQRRPATSRTTTRKPARAVPTKTVRKGKKSGLPFKNIDVKTIIIIASVVVGIIVGGAVLSSVIKHVVDSPKAVIAQLEQEMNEFDLEGMIECFDPTTQEQINMITGIVSSIVEFDIFDAINGLIGLNYLIDDEDSIDFDQVQFQLNVTDVQRDGDVAILSVDFVTIYEGEASSSQDQVKVVKVDGKWYIDGSDLLSELF